MTSTDALGAWPRQGSIAHGREPIAQQTIGNHLLRTMAARDFEALRPYLERVPLVTGSTLASTGDRIETICFPEGAVTGLLDVLEDGRRLAVGLIGREGFIGWPALMGSDRCPYDVAVRSEDSTALRIETPHLIAAADRSPALRTHLLRFTTCFIVQMGRTIVSNLIHPIERRTARWLLLYHDRVAGDEIGLTHEELSIMLGVRRASVTDALHQLEGTHAIKSRRGRVLVCDRARLESVAGESYGYAEAEYQRLIAPLG